MAIESHYCRDSRPNLLGCLGEAGTSQLPFRSDELCIIQPGLVDVYNPLAGLKEFNELHAKPLAKNQIPFTVPLVCNLLDPLELQTQIFSEYLFDVVVLQFQPMLLLYQMLHHRGLVDDMALLQQAYGLSHHQVDCLLFPFISCSKFLQELLIIFGLPHQTADCSSLHSQDFRNIFILLILN
jgi:hypothetical protein